MDERARLRYFILVIGALALLFATALMYYLHESIPYTTDTNFDRNLAIAGIAASLFIILGSYSFYRAASPLILRLEEGERRTDRIIATASDGILTLNEDGYVETFNPAAEAIFGYRQSEIAGAHVGVLLSSENRPNEDADLLEFLRASSVETVGLAHEVQGLRKEGEAFPMEFSASTVEFGDTRYFTAIIRDVTQRRLAQETMEKARRELERRVQERTSDFQRANEKLHEEIAKQKKSEEERQKLLEQLQAALANIKTLSGLIPICSACKKVRDDQGFWNQIETYVHKHSHAEFSHGVCPDCMKELYPDFDLEPDGEETGPE
jgi:PAS domain S-box-containing protein